MTPIRQPSIVTEISSPKYSIGLKLEKRSTEKPAISVNDVKNIGIPEAISADFKRSLRPIACSVFENRIRKWILLSTPSPTAILAIREVIKSSGIRK